MTTARRVDGVDISHYQAGALDLAAAKRAGVRWLFHKATEGTSYKDPGYGQRRAQAKAAGLPFGAYHFARPSGGAADGIAEAKFFLSYAKPVPGDMRPMLDLEVNGGLGQSALTAWVGAFVGEVHRVTGQAPFIYTHFNLDRHFDCPLWVARYSNANAAPVVPKPWASWAVWQFSNGVYGAPTSVPGLGHVDLNTMNGDPAHLTQTFRLPLPATAPAAATTRGRNVDAALAAGRKAAAQNTGHPLKLAKIRAALRALRSIKPRRTTR